MQLHCPVMIYNLIRAKADTSAATGAQFFFQHAFF
jgi:hypothetical protein